MNAENQKPLLSVAPQFDDPMAMVRSGLATVLAVPLITIGAGGLLFILLSLIGIGKFIGAGFFFGLIFVATLVVFPPLFYEKNKQAYARTFFNFYDGYMDYQYYQFFVFLRRGRLRYKDIENITQSASTMQQQRRLMTVVLFVPSLYYQQKGFPGIKLVDLPQAHDYMTHIMNIVEGCVPAPQPQQTPLAAGAVNG